jgi:hypothetical protein
MCPANHPSSSKGTCIVEAAVVNAKTAMIDGKLAGQPISMPREFLNLQRLLHPPDFCILFTFLFSCTFYNNPPCILPYEHSSFAFASALEFVSCGTGIISVTLAMGLALYEGFDGVISCVVAFVGGEPCLIVFVSMHACLV